MALPRLDVDHRLRERVVAGQRRVGDDLDRGIGMIGEQLLDALDLIECIVAWQQASNFSAAPSNCHFLALFSQNNSKPAASHNSLRCRKRSDQCGDLFPPEERPGSTPEELKAAA
jgi:hypothetical protein